MNANDTQAIAAILRDNRWNDFNVLVDDLADYMAAHQRPCQCKGQPLISLGIPNSCDWCGTSWTPFDRNAFIQACYGEN